MAITLRHDAAGLAGAFAEGQAKRRSQLSKYGMDLVGQQQKYTQDNLARMQDYAQENQQQIRNNMFQLRRDELEAQRTSERDKIRHQHDTERDRAGYDNDMRRMDKQQEWDAERRYQQREWELAQDALDNGEFDPPFDTQLRDNLRKEAAILSNRKMDQVQRQALLDTVRSERDLIMRNRKPRKPQEAPAPPTTPDPPSFQDFGKQNPGEVEKRYRAELERLQKQQEQAKTLGEEPPFKDINEMRKAAMDMVEQDYDYVRNRIIPPAAAPGAPTGAPGAAVSPPVPGAAPSSPLNPGGQLPKTGGGTPGNPSAPSGSAASGGSPAQGVGGATYGNWEPYGADQQRRLVSLPDGTSYYEVDWLENPTGFAKPGGVGAPGQAAAPGSPAAPPMSREEQLKKDLHEGLSAMGGKHPPSWNDPIKPTSPGASMDPGFNVKPSGPNTDPGFNVQPSGPGASMDPGFDAGGIKDAGFAGGLANPVAPPKRPKKPQAGKASDGMAEGMRDVRSAADPSDLGDWSSGMSKIYESAKDSRSRSIVANAMKLGEKAHPRIRQALALALDQNTPRDQRMAAVSFLMANGIQLRNLADK